MERHNYYEWIENINDINILKNRFNEFNTIFLALEHIIIEKYGLEAYLEISKEAAIKASIDWLHDIKSHKQTMNE